MTLDEQAIEHLRISRKHLEVKVKMYAEYIESEMRKIRGMYSDTAAHAQKMLSGETITREEAEEMIEERAQYDTEIQKSLLIIRGASQKLARLNNNTSAAIGSIIRQRADGGS